MKLTRSYFPEFPLCPSTLNTFSLSPLIPRKLHFVEVPQNSETFNIEVKTWNFLCHSIPLFSYTSGQDFCYFFAEWQKIYFTVWPIFQLDWCVVLDCRPFWYCGTTVIASIHKVNSLHSRHPWNIKLGEGGNNCSPSQLVQLKCPSSLIMLGWAERDYSAKVMEVNKLTTFLPNVDDYSWTNGYPSLRLPATGLCLKSRVWKGFFF